MGIDLEIAVGLKKAPTRQFVERFKNLYRECSVIDGDIYEDVDSIENPERFEFTLGISSCTRYYGEYYERGPFISIYGTLLFLAKYLKDYEPTLFYGGDSSEYIPEINHEDLENIMDHFIQNGKAPYRDSNYDMAVIEDCPSMDKSQN